MDAVDQNYSTPHSTRWKNSAIIILGAKVHSLQLQSQGSIYIPHMEVSSINHVTRSTGPIFDLYH